MNFVDDDSIVLLKSDLSILHSLRESDQIDAVALQWLVPTVEGERESLQLAVLISMEIVWKKIYVKGMIT